jgi:hypothetical protein
MAVDAERRLRAFEEEERFEQASGSAERTLGSVGEAVKEHLKETERWVPGHWKGGEWIPGFWKVERRTTRLVGDGVVIEAETAHAVHVPGRFGPRTWVEGETVAHTGLRTAGKWLGRGMAGLDVGLAGWEDWSKHGQLQGAERFGHATWAAATLGGGSAVGTWAGYIGGAAAVGALVGMAPVLLPVGGALAVVGGIGGAMIGSQLGRRAGAFGKSLVDTGGTAVVSGAKRVMRWFR